MSSNYFWTKIIVTFSIIVCFLNMLYFGINDDSEALKKTYRGLSCLFFICGILLIFVLFSF